MPAPQPNDRARRHTSTSGTHHRLDSGSASGYCGSNGLPLRAVVWREGCTGRRPERRALLTGLLAVVLALASPLSVLAAIVEDDARAGRPLGDAQTVRLLASPRREGMPEELLIKAFWACRDAYTPEVDRLRSPFVHSLVWFQPWIENVADP